MADSPTVHQLKITLHESKPPIWRRVLLPSSATLFQLHGVIQESFGWIGYHLHECEIAGTRYGDAEDDDGWDDDDDELIDEHSVTLAELAPSGTTFTYTYDFGDNWRHDIEVEDVVAADPKVHYPHCTAGKRACPPEDVGGMGGYHEFLAAIADPSHPEHAERLESVDGSFDPEACDLAAINVALTLVEVSPLP